MEFHQQSCILHMSWTSCLVFWGYDPKSFILDPPDYSQETHKTGLNRTSKKTDGPATKKEKPRHYVHTHWG